MSCLYLYNIMNALANGLDTLHNRKRGIIEREIDA